MRKEWNTVLRRWNCRHDKSSPRKRKPQAPRVSSALIVMVPINYDNGPSVYSFRPFASLLRPTRLFSFFALSISIYFKIIIIIITIIFFTMKKVKILFHSSQRTRYRISRRNFDDEKEKWHKRARNSTKGTKWH